MTFIDKIQALKEEIAVEMEKEEPDQFLIDKLKNKIIALGLALRIADINNKSWIKK